MQRLLLAYRAGSFSRDLTQELNKNFEVHSCYRGDAALALLDSLRPDILILEALLPWMDGVTLLKSAAYTPPRILVLTSLWDTRALEALWDVGVSEILPIPCTVASVLSLLKVKAPSPGR